MTRIDESTPFRPDSIETNPLNGTRELPPARTSGLERAVEETSRVPIDHDGRVVAGEGPGHPMLAVAGALQQKSSFALKNQELYPNTVGLDVVLAQLGNNEQTRGA